MRNVLTFAAMVALVGCGAKKGAEEPTGPTSAEESDPGEGEADDPEFIQPEKIDEIKHAFARRRPQISDCYAKVVRAGKLSKKEGGRVAVVAHIAITGRATKVDIMPGATTLKSDALNECIVDEIKKWDLPRPNIAFEFSFSYDFLEGI
jgi:hypothetical protein